MMVRGGGRECMMVRGGGRECTMGSGKEAVCDGQGRRQYVMVREGGSM